MFFVGRFAAVGFAAAGFAAAGFAAVGFAAVGFAAVGAENRPKSDFSQQYSPISYLCQALIPANVEC